MPRPFFLSSAAASRSRSSSAAALFSLRLCLRLPLPPFHRLLLLDPPRRVHFPLPFISHPLLRMSLGGLIRRETIIVVVAALRRADHTDLAAAAEVLRVVRIRRHEKIPAERDGIDRKGVAVVVVAPQTGRVTAPRLPAGCCCSSSPPAARRHRSVGCPSGSGTDFCGCYIRDYGFVREHLVADGTRRVVRFDGSLESNMEILSPHATYSLPLDVAKIGGTCDLHLTTFFIVNPIALLAGPRLEAPRASTIASPRPLLASDVEYLDAGLAEGPDLLD